MKRILISAVALLLVIIASPSAQSQTDENQVNDAESIKRDIDKFTSALKSFELQYGFVPPDMLKIDTPQKFLPYLNRIARRHNEGNGDPGTGLHIWWNAVGQHLHAKGPEAALTFWLSGIARNAQYPLTVADPDGAGRIAVPAHNANAVGSAGTEVEISRALFIELATERLQVDGSIACLMPVQRTGDQPLLYFERSSRELFADGETYTTSGGAKVSPYHNNGDFVSGSFQILSAGPDADFGSTGDMSSKRAEDNDNITNFADSMEGHFEGLAASPSEKPAPMKREADGQNDVANASPSPSAVLAKTDEALRLIESTKQLIDRSEQEFERRFRKIVKNYRLAEVRLEVVNQRISADEANLAKIEEQLPRLKNLMAEAEGDVATLEELNTKLKNAARIYRDGKTRLQGRRESARILEELIEPLKEQAIMARTLETQRLESHAQLERKQSSLNLIRKVAADQLENKAPATELLTTLQAEIDEIIEIDKALQSKMDLFQQQR